LEDAPADLTMAAKAIFKQILGSKPTTSRTTYRYDALGRRIERRASMFGMTENRTTWEYAEHDEPVRQTDEYVSREMNIDESGNRQPTEEKSARHEIRFDYKFDATGNWIERLVSFRTGANPEFQRSNIERRQVTYAPDPSLESLKDRGWREVAAINQAFAAGQIDDTAWHEAMAALVKPAYLAAENPYAQAGHSGDAASWEASRGFIAQALHRSGTFLDVGCANGILMESVHRWGTNKGLQIEPYGMDIVPEFVERARRRLPQWADRIYLGNIRTWRPVQDRFDFVLIRPEYAPSKREADMVRNILDHVLAPDGRLIVFVGAEEKEARLVESSIVSAGFSVAGRVEVPHSKDARVVRRLFWLDGFHA
jgi:YD repeat-containing protein